MMFISLCLKCTSLQYSRVNHISRQLLISKPRLWPYHRSFKFGQWISTVAWIPPEGCFDTGITVYNTASKSKVPLKTLQPNLLSWYMCGPTVYDSAHIGHAMCYVNFDIIRRIFEDVFNITVVQVMGITDIDDKIIARANWRESSIEVVSQQYEEEFFKDMDRLRVLRPSISSRVTDHIPQIITFVQNIVDNGCGYIVEDGTVCFDTEAYGRCGKFQSPPDGLNNPEVSYKKSPKDFILWKPVKPGEPSWPSPWGLGRPGWHIECSVMACEIFGKKLDMHSGGIDLVFPHHENEEAQCCAHNNTLQWCNYWIHTGHLNLKADQKMSKSLFNTISVDELLSCHSVNAFRMFCLLQHYSNHVMHCESNYDLATSHLRKIRSFLHDANAYTKNQLYCAPLDTALILQTLAETRVKVKNFLADDFNTSRAMGAIIELIHLCNKELLKRSRNPSTTQGVGAIADVSRYIIRLMETFGLEVFQQVDTYSSDGENKLPNVMSSLLAFRNEVRKYALLQTEQGLEDLSKDEKKLKKEERRPLLVASDNLRSGLLSYGLVVKDHESSSSWSVKEEETETGEDKKSP